MGAFARSALIAGIALFLEGFAVYLGCRLFAHVIRLPDASVPLSIAMLAVGWSFILSWYVQTIRFSLNLRGIIGLVLSAVSVLALAGISMGAGWFPVGEVFSGDLRAAAALGLSAIFMLLLWWRGTAIARDDVTLDVVRNAFVRGVVVIIVAVTADTLLSAAIIRLPALLAFFATGLAGLAISRFAAEGGAGRMNRGWMLAILFSVGGLLLLAVILGAIASAAWTLQLAPFSKGWPSSACGLSGRFSCCWGSWRPDSWQWATGFPACLAAAISAAWNWPGCRSKNSTKACVRSRATAHPASS